jgi:hypothetical protein
MRGIMEAEVREKTGAGYGERTPERVTQRNGDRARPWDTRVGTLELRIPKVRGGELLSDPAGSEAAERTGVAVGGAAGLHRRGIDTVRR